MGTFYILPIFANISYVYEDSAVMIWNTTKH